MKQPDTEQQETATKKSWTSPELIIIDSENVKHAANTVSDGTGNLFS